MKADQLSKTAAFVAIKFYGLTREDHFRSLFEPSIINFYDKIVQSLPAPLSYYHYWLQFEWIRKSYIWAEELLLPGDLLHIIARKRYIQNIIEKLVEQEFEQIIVLGAGFDHLGYHYSKKGLCCYEIDTPQMAALKQQFLQKSYPGRSHPEIIHFHFSEDKQISEIINHSNINESRKTIVVAEGFFDYLTPNKVGQIVNQLRTRFSNNLKLISTHFALDELPKLHRRIFESSVRMVGEPLRLEASIEDYKQILNDNGYGISQLHDIRTISEDIKPKINTSLPLLKGFYILSAEL